MQINIYRDKLLGARLFGTPVLFSAQPIPREDVPQGWYCYDLRGTARHPDEPHALVDMAEENHTGSILSCLPLKKARSQFRLVKDMFQMTGTNPSLAEFCAEEKIRCPEIPLRHQLCPASPEDAGLFYAQTPERDEELGAIGHVRIDFGHNGREGFYHTWWPRGPEGLNTQEFRDELDAVVNDLRKGVLKDLSSMRRYCSGSEGAIEGGTCCQNYGFTLETERYLYRLRCNPIEGDYQCYLSCFDKQAQQMGMTESGTEQRVCQPEIPLQHTLSPTLPEDEGHFYVYDSSSQRHLELGIVGQLRFDFGSSPGQVWRTWWRRTDKDMRTPEFKKELEQVVAHMRQEVLKDLDSMRHWCKENGGVLKNGQDYGYMVETERYHYCLRCSPSDKSDQAYLTCFDKQAQQMGLTEKGRQALRDTADPTLPHSYDWHVIEHINTPERQVTHQLPLEEAMQLYTSLDCADKRLGVTKDGIAAVDLAIHQEGREWLSMDRLKLDSFKDDPVVAGAVGQIQKMLDESPAVGRVTFASGERWNYTDPQKYLQTVREELPCQATTGFRCETLTDDPVVRKAVDDMIYDLYGEENPRQIEDYGGLNMTMGGFVQ